MYQNIIAFLSFPWLANETNGHDLDYIKDKGYKQCSLNLVQQTPRPQLISLKKQCVQLLCLLPKSICPIWRTHIISKCVKDDTDESLRICALKYLPYLIYFLGASSNSLVFQLIHPALNEEKSLNVINSYAILLDLICCLMSRKLVIVRRAVFSIEEISYSDNQDEMRFTEMSDYFEPLCACCDKKKIDLKILPNLTRHENLVMFQKLYDRPKNVDTKVLMQFIYMLSSAKMLNQNQGNTNNSNNNNNETTKNDTQMIQIKSKLLANLEKAFNHLEFNRGLDQQTLVSHEFLISSVMADKTASHIKNINNNNNTNSNLTYIYKETLNLFGDETLDSQIRFDFARFSIPKLICFNASTNIITLPPTIRSANNQGGKGKDKQLVASSTSSSIYDETVSNSMSNSIFSLLNQSDPQLDHNFNLENQLCEGFLRAKSSKNLVELYVYMVALGRFALSLKRCDEYLFVCVKHLLEIFDTDESSDWSLLACSVNYFIFKVSISEIISSYKQEKLERI